MCLTAGNAYGLGIYLTSLGRVIQLGEKYNIMPAHRLYNKGDFNFEKQLYTHGIPDPEILVRTGGAKRLSNFLLWQMAYTEIFFIDKLWPDFNENDFNKIILKYNKIKRNFGKI